MKTITKKQFETLRAHACGEWKTKLTNWFGDMYFDGEIKVTEEQINQMRKAADDNQRKILDEIFGGFKVGDWVKLPKLRPVTTWAKTGVMDKYLGKVVQITGLDGSKFMFDGYDSWSFYLEDVRHATEQEIKDALLEEARKRYPVGTRFKDAVDGVVEISEKSPFFYKGLGVAVRDYKGVVYHNGKWAEIVKDKKVKDEKVVANVYRDVRGGIVIWEADYEPTSFYKCLGSIEINLKDLKK